jgi:uncharacterized membrane protein (DUF373 family)
LKIDIDVKGIFDRTIKVVFSALLLLLTLSIVIGAVHLFASLGSMLIRRELSPGDYQSIISDVLTIFIVIELARSLVEYFHVNRLRMTFIVDAAIVFVLREIMIKVFEHTMGPAEIYALSALLFVLTVLRIGSAMVYQREIQVRRSP